MPADDEDADEEACTSELDKQAMLPITKHTLPHASIQETAAEPRGMSEARMLELVQHVFDRLEHPGAEDLSSEEHTMSFLYTIMLDPTEFVASNLTKHLVAWQALFDKLGHSKRSRQVLDWVAHGIKLAFVSPFSPGQEKYHRYHT